MTLTLVIIHILQMVVVALGIFVIGCITSNGVDDQEGAVCAMGLTLCIMSLVGLICYFLHVIILIVGVFA